MKRKAFSQKLYNKYDEKGKLAAIDFITTLCVADAHLPKKENFKNFDIEVMILDPLQLKNPLGGPGLLAIEVECKRGWKKSGSWQPQWKTIDFPAIKYIDSKAEFVLMFNATYDTAAFILRKQLIEYDTYKKNTIYTKNETFFGVPVKNMRFATKHKQENWTLVSKTGRRLFSGV